MRRILIKLSNW